MHNFLTAGLVKKITLYSANPQKFALKESKKIVLEELGKEIDLSLYEERVIDEEISLTLKEDVLSKNVKNFLKEIEEYMGTFVSFDEVNGVDYVERDCIEEKLRFIGDSLGIDIDYFKIWNCPIEILSGSNILTNTLNKFARKGIDNILGKTLVFYVEN